MDANTERHIRARLEKATKRPIPDLIWRDLLADRRALDTDTPEFFPDLLAEARRSLRYLDLGARGEVVRHEPAGSGRAALGPRARAFEALVAREVEVEPIVSALRKWWGGGRLGRDEAIALAPSAAWCLPYVDQLTRYPEAQTAQRGGVESVRGVESRVASEEFEARDGHGGWRWEVEFRWGSAHRTSSLWANESAMDQITIAVPRAEALPVRAMKYSLTGRLIEVARALARLAPWTEEDAAWFVLTGDPPPVAPIAFAVQRQMGPGYHRAVVKLEIEPWVPQDLVLSAYRQAQAEVLPKANRPISERTAELARFGAGDAGNLTVAAAMRLWNEKHPQWATLDRRNFQRHARQAQRFIAAPPWRPFSHGD
jgi:hypothetical protein